MEKFSRFRDDSTGIQVFLTPIPPVSSASAASFVVLPIAWVLGVVRSLVLVVLGLLWAVLGATVGSASLGARSSIDAIFGRSVLATLGFLRISTENVSLKARGRASSKRNDVVPFTPGKGDVILSNHSSWVDVLFLVTRFSSPSFVLPVVTARPNPTRGSSTSTRSPAAAARRRGEKQASTPPTIEEMKTQAPPGVSMPRLIGWRRVGWLQAVQHAGRTPLVEEPGARADVKGLEAILSESQGPVVVFPELTTSNNRGLLKMASPLFPSAWSSLYRATGALRMGAGQADIYVVTIKHGAPSTLSPSTVSSVPSSSWNPLPHALKLLFSLPIGRTLQVRLLNPAESPTSASSTTSDKQGGQAGRLEDWVGETMSSLSRLRRTGLGWEDKEVFLDLCGV